ncbi:MAG TPA: hypothetical protein VE197_13990 [Mycobacterium sp.]|nr:hypothetical protein [Mycobacterium sp.]
MSDCPLGAQQAAGHRGRDGDAESSEPPRISLTSAWVMNTPSNALVSTAAPIVGSCSTEVSASRSWAIIAVVRKLWGGLLIVTVSTRASRSTLIVDMSNSFTCHLAVGVPTREFVADLPPPTGRWRCSSAIEPVC